MIVAFIAIAIIASVRSVASATNGKWNVVSQNVASNM